MRDKELRSEKAQKKACRMLKTGAARVQQLEDNTVVAVIDVETRDVIAYFDLRDSYLLRKPLTGINKTMSGIIRGKK